jgi:hypothetical protein
MRAVFVETSNFTEWISDHLDDGEYAMIQRLLMDQPDIGAVMPGCGGLRKLRIADPVRRKGRRGGARIIYLHIPEVSRFYLLDVYGKNEKSDLSADERRFLRRIADQIRAAATSKLKP